MRNGWYLIPVTLIAILLPLFISVGRAVEPRIFPVITPPGLILTSNQPTDDGRRIIYTEFTKDRECEFLVLKWFDQSGREVGFEFREELPDEFAGGLTRPLGEHEAGPWIVYSNNIDNTYSKSYHKCHPFWTTVSTVFVGKNIIL